jgi:hypothetical protein
MPAPAARVGVVAPAVTAGPHSGIGVLFFSTRSHWHHPPPERPALPHPPAEPVVASGDRQISTLSYVPRATLLVAQAVEVGREKTCQVVDAGCFRCVGDTRGGDIPPPRPF